MKKTLLKLFAVVTAVISLVSCDDSGTKKLQVPYECLEATVVVDSNGAIWVADFYPSVLTELDILYVTRKILMTYDEGTNFYLIKAFDLLITKCPQLDGYSMTFNCSDIETAVWNCDINYSSNDDHIREVFDKIHYDMDITYTYQR